MFLKMFECISAKTLPRQELRFTSISFFMAQLKVDRKAVQSVQNKENQGWKLMSAVQFICS